MTKFVKIKDALPDERLLIEQFITKKRCFPEKLSVHQTIIAHLSTRCAADFFFVMPRQKIFVSIGWRRARASPRASILIKCFVAVGGVTHSAALSVWVYQR